MTEQLHPYFGLFVMIFLVGAICAWLLRRGGQKPDAARRDSQNASWSGGAADSADTDRAPRYFCDFSQICVLFLIFLCAVVLVLPWAVGLKILGSFSTAVAVLFLALLGLGMAHAWRSGVFE